MSVHDVGPISITLTAAGPCWGDPPAGLTGVLVRPHSSSSCTTFLPPPPSRPPSPEARRPRRAAHVTGVPVERRQRQEARYKKTPRVHGALFNMSQAVG